MRHVSTGGLDVDREFFTAAVPQSAVARMNLSTKGVGTSAAPASGAGAGATSTTSTGAAS
jgi:hypothetical protein